MAMVLAASPSGLLLPGIVRAASPAVLQYPDNLFGYWGFDPDCVDFAAGKALDLSQNFNHGTLNNLAASTMVDGQVGSALNFNGSSSYISVAGSGFPAISTICFWVNFNSIGAGENSMMFERDDDNSNWGISLEMNASNPRMSHVNGAGSSGNTISSTALVSGIWYHLTLSWDGVSMVLYINGQKDMSQGTVGGTMRGPGTQYTFGGLGLTGGRYFSGKMDDVRIYSRALNAAEIGALYHAGLNGSREIRL